jgi:hypothetical protein
MATLDELSTALRNADAAGDVDAARALAAEITKMRGSSAPAAAPQAVGALEDAAKSGGSGLLKGVASFVGLGGDISKGLGAATQSMEKRGVPVQESRQAMLDVMPEWLRKYHQPRQTMTGLVTGAAPVDRPVIGSAEVRGAMDSAAGAPIASYKPQTTGGEYAGTVGEFVGNPMSYMGPGGMTMKAVTAALSGAGSEAAGQATKGGAAEPYARVGGAIAGALAPAGMARAVTPAPASAARQRLVDVLENEGVTSITAGQRTGNETLRYAESVLGNAPMSGQQTSRIYREGQEQFTDAALRRAGTSGAATPDVLQANNTRLGDQFRDLSARNTLQMDPQFASDVRRVIQEYGRVLPSEQRQQLYNIITDIGQHGNAIPGQVYQTTRSRLSRSASDNAAGGDAEFGRAMGGLRDALDDAMGRSISPADRQLWNESRRQWGAQKVIERTASRAGEATAEGMVTPANLRNTVSAENRGAYARGEGDFSELARAGAGVMGQMPQSGTAPRSALYNMGNYLTAGALPALAGRALMSGPVQAYLGNQAAMPLLNHLNPRQSALINALAATQQQSLGAPR